MWLVYIVAISALGVAAELYLIERAHAGFDTSGAHVVANAQRGGAA